MCSWLPLLPSDYGILPCCSTRMPPHCHSHALSGPRSKPLSITSPPPHQETCISDWGSQGCSTDYTHGFCLVLPATDRLLSSPLILQSHKPPCLSLLVPFLEWAFMGVGTSLLQLPLRSVDSIPFPLLFPLSFFFTSYPVSQEFFSCPLGSPRSSTSVQ